MFVAEESFGEDFTHDGIDLAPFDREGLLAFFAKLTNYFRPQFVLREKRLQEDLFRDFEGRAEKFR